MTNFSLSIASCDFTSEGFIIVKLFLFFSSHQLDVFDKHAEMNSSMHLKRIDYHVVDCKYFVILKIIKVAHIEVIEHRKVFGSFNDVLEPSLVVEVGSIFLSGSFFQVVFEVLVVLLAIEEGPELLWSEWGLESFMFEYRFHDELINV